MRGFFAHEVMKMAGVNYRRLDYWCRIGLVTPSISDAHGSGQNRLYSEFDVARVRTIRILADQGLRLSAIRRMLDSVERIEHMQRVLDEAREQLHEAV